MRATKQDLEQVRVLMDAVLDTQGRSADEPVGELLGVAKRLRAIGSSSASMATGFTPHLDRLADEIEASLEKVRQIKSEPVAELVRTIATRMNLRPLALDEYFNRGNELLISLHQHRLRAYVRDIQLNSEMPDFAVDYYGMQSATRRRPYRHVVRITLDAIPDEDPPTLAGPLEPF